MIEYLEGHERLMSIDNVVLSFTQLESINNRHMKRLFRYTPICCISVVPGGSKPTGNFSKSLKQTIRTSRRNLGAVELKYETISEITLEEIYSSKVRKSKRGEVNRRILAII